MKTDEAIKILEQHQLWRKGEPPYGQGGEGMPHTPVELGAALTHAIDCMNQTQWQDISTAPKNTPVLVANTDNDKYKIFIAEYIAKRSIDYDSSNFIFEYYDTQDMCFHCPEGWYFIVGNSESLGYQYQTILQTPTHWRPLDAPKDGE